MRGYRSKDVAGLLGLPVAEVRRFAREGLVAPRRGERGALTFSFRDLVLLRSAAELAAESIPPARVARTLRRLREQLPPDRPLTALRLFAEGDRVAVQEGGARWRPDTGQVLLDLERARSGPPRGLAATVAPLARPAAPAGAPRDAEGWYRLGRELEGPSPAKARAAYRCALALDGGHPGAHLALGRLLHREGDPRAAELHYRLALASPAHRARACLALGAVLEDQDLLDEALLACARAIAADPALAEAHLSAARLLERLGRPAEARRHLVEYRRLRGRP